LWSWIEEERFRYTSSLEAGWGMGAGSCMQTEEKVEGTCEKSRQAGRPREIHEERKDERSLDVRQVDVNNANVAVDQC
jgi:hypothetical protein